MKESNLTVRKVSKEPNTSIQALSFLGHVRSEVQVFEFWEFRSILNPMEAHIGDFETNRSEIVGIRHQF